ncbi:MAG TPA: lipoyl synthase [Candidatus Tidjanibacter gallistercoris]|nr:lipoyl synthase [Candidatus Tidjanibacter gallistercoris]
MSDTYDKVAKNIKPGWLKIKLHNDVRYADVSKIVEKHRLHTICDSGKCPNKAECWSRKTATFMILGDVCTRSCKFCATRTGRPLPPEPGEPEEVAESIRLMGLKHAVLTSVDRDDLPDGGAAHWAATVRAIRKATPDTTIEVLIPDFDGRKELLDIVIDAAPDIIGHNIETVERLTPLVRSRARYGTSMEVLRYIASRGVMAKSGLMLGLGETETEILATLDDLADAGCSIVTLGQYLRPTMKHYPVAEYVTPQKFAMYGDLARMRGFKYVASAPLVRSSYMAEEALLHFRKED